MKYRFLALFAALTLALLACASRPVRPGILPPPIDTSTLGPGDQFDILIVGEEKLPQTYLIEPNGTVNFPWIKRQQVAGLEPSELAERVRKQLVDMHFLSDPTVLVTVKAYNSKHVTLGGAVAKPGDVPFFPGLTLYHLITSSGGFAASANRDNVLVTRRTTDGKRVTVSFAVEDIAEGRAPDVPLQAGDNVYVYDRPFLAIVSTMKRVAVLYTGGTLMMRPGASGALLPDAHGHDLVAELPVLARIASLEAHVVCNLDSGDMQPDDWVLIAREVHSALSRDDVDGVVVVHGTDTMAYTASAVAFLLGAVPKPVVFTGAQRPLSLTRTDARANLVDACILATLPLAEVGIAFASKLWRAVRATKRDAWALDAFDSPNCPCLVDLGLGEAILPHVRGGQPLLPFDARLDKRVLAVRVFPGLDPDALLRALEAGARGLLLEGYGTGNLPHLAGSLIPVLEEARRRDVPVMVVSQCLRGAVELTRYAGGEAARLAGAVSGGDMTVEAALAKMMIALGRFDSAAEVRAFLERDVVGERTS